MVIDTLAFRLDDSADEEAFLEADRRMQTECLPTHAGFLRRTTARSASQSRAWLVITLWGSPEEADASAARSAEHPAMQTFTALIDEVSVCRGRYFTLE